MIDKESLNVSNALYFLEHENFFEFGNSFNGFYFNFKLKGNHYFKAIWVDYNKSLDRIIIRVKEHSYKILSLSKVEKITIVFSELEPEFCDVVERIDLVRFCDLLRNFYSDGAFHLLLKDYDFVFVDDTDETKSLELYMQYSKLFKTFSDFKALNEKKNLSGQEILTEYLKNGGKFYITTQLGQRLKLISCNGKNLSSLYQDYIKEIEEKRKTR